MSKGYKDLNEQAEAMFAKLGFVVHQENNVFKKYVKQINNATSYLDFSYQLDIVMFDFKKGKTTYTRYFETMGITRDEPVRSKELQAAIALQEKAYIARYSI